MTAAELIKQLLKVPPETEVKVMIYDPTYDEAGKIIEHDNYRDSPITNVHSAFCSSDDKPFVSIETPSEDFATQILPPKGELTISVGCDVPGCTAKFSNLQRMASHKWGVHGIRRWKRKEEVGK